MTTSPSATFAVSEAVLTSVDAGVGASIVTVSSAVEGDKAPVCGIEFNVAVFVISVPESTSSCVTVYVAVKIWDSPGAKLILAGVMADKVPVPE